MLVTTIAANRRDEVLDLFGKFAPVGQCPTVDDLAECLETALRLIGTPWVWHLATVETRHGFARRLSSVAPIDLLVSDSVHSYCRSH